MKTAQMETLLIVDAYALLYRAHFAFLQRPLLTADGRNTSAAFGFLRSFLECVEEEKPGYIAVVFDPKGGSFRNQLSADYKADRPPTPDAVRYGAEKIGELLPLLGIKTLVEPGFEADDLAGSLVQQFAPQGYRIVLFTPDKDYQQLLADNVEMVKPRRTGKGVERVTLAMLQEKYGIERAEQFVDILALWGDAADNVPGLPGVGEKTAAALIAKYGGIDRLYGNTGKLTPKVAKGLAECAQQLKVARELVTIRRDAPVPNDIRELKPTPVNRAAAQTIFDELEFKVVAKDLLKALGGDDASDATQPAPVDAPAAAETTASLADRPHSYRLVVTEPEWQAMLQEIGEAGVLAIDTETSGLNPHQDHPVGVSLCCRPWQAWYAPLDSEHDSLYGQKIAWLNTLLANPARCIVGHNIKFDLLMLRSVGVELHGTLYDTMILHYLLAPDAGHSLDAVAQKELEYTPIPFEALQPGVKANEIDLATVPLDRLTEYAAEDADIALQLYHTLWDQVQKQKLDWLYSQVEGPLIRVLADMEWAGVAIVPQRLEELGTTLKAQLESLSQQIRTAVANPDLNIDSPLQVGKALFEQLNINPKAKRTKTGQYNTSELELAKYAKEFPVVQTLLDYREARKLLNTYVTALPALIDPHTHRIHALFNQAVAGTGRLSSSHPNMQNIPVRNDYGKQIRRAFVTAFEGGELLSADYSQIELRVMAHVANDENMIAAFREGADIHRATAARILGLPPEEVTPAQRESAKRVNFGVVYGISGYGLSQQLGIPVAEANSFIRSYLDHYPGIEDYMRSTIEFARKNGYVQTIWGRRRWLPDINSPSPVIRGAVERHAINAPIQGTAADIIKRAMVNIADEIRSRKLRSTLIIQVHDELILDVYPGEMDAVRSLVVSRMEQAIELSVPLVVDVAVGKDWGTIG